MTEKKWILSLHFTPLRGGLCGKWYCLKKDHELFQTKINLWQRVLNHLHKIYKEYSSPLDGVHREIFRTSFIDKFQSIMSAIEDAM